MVATTEEQKVKTSAVVWVGGEFIVDADLVKFVRL